MLDTFVTILIVKFTLLFLFVYSQFLLFCALLSHSFILISIWNVKVLVKQMHLPIHLIMSLVKSIVLLEVNKESNKKCVSTRRMKLWIEMILCCFHEFFFEFLRDDWFLSLLGNVTLEEHLFSDGFPFWLLILNALYQ